MTSRWKNKDGMTLIEIIVAMAVAFIVAGAIFATYRTQQMTHLTQRALLEMNQNLRSAAYYITRDLRMGGYDPTWNAQASFLIANEAELQFQWDQNRNGVIDGGNEVVRYALDNDADRDGVANGYPCNLSREEGNGGLQVLAENIEAIDFEYMTYSAAPPMGPVSMNTGGVTPDGVAIGPPANLQDNIRFVRVTIVACSGEAMPRMSFRQTDTQAYTNADGSRTVMTNYVGRNNDLRRTVLTTEIQLRNM